MDPLSPTQRRALRASAHNLEPVVTVGHHGLTAPVQHEIDLALIAHELVKVRVLGDDREAREAMLAQVCAALGCAPVQHVGKVLVLWRANPEKQKKKAAAAVAVKRKAPRKPGPRAPVDAVRERRRKTPSEWAAPSSGTGRRGAARHARPVAEPPAAPASSRRRTRDR